MGVSSLSCFLFAFSLFVVVASGFYRNLPILPFDEGYAHLFGNDNLVVHKDGKSVHLSLDERTGLCFCFLDFVAFVESFSMFLMWVLCIYRVRICVSRPLSSWFLQCFNKVAC